MEPNYRIRSFYETTEKYPVQFALKNYRHQESKGSSSKKVGANDEKRLKNIAFTWKNVIPLTENRRQWIRFWKSVF